MLPGFEFERAVGGDFKAAVADAVGVDVARIRVGRLQFANGGAVFAFCNLAVGEGNVGRRVVATWRWGLPATVVDSDGCLVTDLSCEVSDFVFHRGRVAGKARFGGKDDFAEADVPFDLPGDGDFGDTVAGSVDESQATWVKVALIVGINAIVVVQYVNDGGGTRCAFDRVIFCFRSCVSCWRRCRGRRLRYRWRGIRITGVVGVTWIIGVGWVVRLVAAWAIGVRRGRRLVARIVGIVWIRRVGIAGVVRVVGRGGVAAVAIIIAAIVALAAIVACQANASCHQPNGAQHAQRRPDGLVRAEGLFGGDLFGEDVFRCGSDRVAG